ncbi:hypothetical protein [Clostridium sp.]|uniref:hypothetical protein n=1 Tax=Clostridium sp. TaxID=1506 RepID=UPI002914C61A|nr:hypothetical protein [Clostridium sp.]MDU4589932.1 hypothetical protein [Clostridium sp.]
MNEYGLNIYNISIPIITALIAYLGSRYQYKYELKKVKEQCKTDIDKIEQQCKSDIKKIKEQCEVDIKKIETQSRTEIQKLIIESDKKADMYEKNKQTDMVANFMEKFMKNPKAGMKTIEELKNLMNSLP